MTDRATSWSVTINNPTDSDEEHIAMARQKGWKVDGQLEKGEKGTPHYQLIVKTPQIRFSAVKKAFPRAHIEIARNPTALEQYVHKDETREGELKQDNEKYLSLQKMWDMFAEYLDDLEDYRGSDMDCGMSEWSQEKWLSRFDDFIKEFILKGFVLETMAVNPQVRSCVKNYGLQLFLRSIDRQTDRQTSKNKVKGEGITNAHDSSQEEVCPSQGEIRSSEEAPNRSVKVPF